MSLSQVFSRLSPWNRSSQVEEFGYELHSFDLAQEGRVEYAQWMHPNETQKSITQPMVDAIRQFVSEGDLVIDIGGHTGDTTLPMALAAGPTGLTIALEPNPYVFKILAKNASLNQEKTHIEAINIAATKDDGEFTFHYTDSMFCNGGFKTEQKWPLFRRRHPLKVQGRDFNHILKTQFPEWLSKLTYLKVDAEGYDLKILETIRPTLAERRPVIRCEVFHKLVASERYALHDFLTGLGYEVVRYLGDEEEPGKPVSREAMTESKHFDMLALPSAKSARQAA